MTIVQPSYDVIFTYGKIRQFMTFNYQVHDTSNALLYTVSLCYFNNGITQ